MPALHLHRFPKLALLALLAFAVLGLGLAPDAWAAPEPAGTSRSGTERVLRVESVEIHETWKTRESVILNLLGLGPGDPVTSASLGAGRQRLMDSGFFRSVELSTRPGSERGLVVVVLTLEERHLPYFETGFGFRDPEGWYLTLLGLRSENTFGLGGSAMLAARLGFRTFGTELDARLPLRGDQRLALGLRLRIYQERLLWYRTEPGWVGLYDECRHDIYRLRSALLLIWRAPYGSVLEFGLGGMTADPSDEAENRDTGETISVPDLPGPLQESAGRLQLGGLQGGFRIGEGGMDGRPGSSFLLGAQFVSRALGADRDYARWITALRHTHSLSAGVSLAFGLRGGLVGEGAPYYERFRIGGSYSIRGFRDQSLSPLGGHRGYWNVSAELRFPLVQGRRALFPRETGALAGEAKPPRLVGVLFYDMGQGWLGYDLSEEDELQVDYEALQMGAGYGARLHLPWLGIVGFDVGVPITAGVTGEAVWYTLTLGHTF